MNHLRSHPIGRAGNIGKLERRRRRRRRGDGGLVDGSGDTEISELHSVEMALAVEVGECVERVSENHSDAGLR